MTQAKLKKKWMKNSGLLNYCPTLKNLRWNPKLAEPEWKPIRNDGAVTNSQHIAMESEGETLF